MSFDHLRPYDQPSETDGPDTGADASDYFDAANGEDTHDEQTDLRADDGDHTEIGDIEEEPAAPRSGRAAELQAAADQAANIALVAAVAENLVFLGGHDMAAAMAAGVALEELSQADELQRQADAARAAELRAAQDQARALAAAQDSSRNSQDSGHTAADSARADGQATVADTEAEASQRAPSDHAAERGNDDPEPQTADTSTDGVAVAMEDEAALRADFSEAASAGSTDEQERATGEQEVTDAHSEDDATEADAAVQTTDRRHDASLDIDYAATDTIEPRAGSDEHHISMRNEWRAKVAVHGEDSPEAVAAWMRMNIGVGRETLIHVLDAEMYEGSSPQEIERIKALEYLPHEGFTQSGIAEVRKQVAAIGYPLDNFKTFAHERNERGTENTLASWTHAEGKFTVYDLSDKEVPEKRLGTMAHESSHSCSPLKEGNDHMFGGPEGQRAAADYVRAVADQSLATGIHLNGYHKMLMERHRAAIEQTERDMRYGRISQAVYDAQMGEANRRWREETWAIMNEMALTKRAALEDVQARQHRAMDDLARHPGATSPAKVDLITQPGNENSTGIDRWLVRLLNGVNNQAELTDHVAALKDKFYPPESRQVARERQQHH